MRCDVYLNDGAVDVRGTIPTACAGELAVTSTPARFELERLTPVAERVLYRLGRGRVELADRAAAAELGAAVRRPDPGELLALIHGLPQAPGSTPLAGVHELMLGDRLRVDPTGISVTRAVPQPAARPQPLSEAVGATLMSSGEAPAIAYSGGLASAFVAVSARAAGGRPELLHAALDGQPPPAPIPGLRIRAIPVSPAELLGAVEITGREPAPPLPDAVLRDALAARLRAAAGRPLAVGALLEQLVSTTLREVRLGWLGYKLLACEPYHASGTLARLSDARAVLDKRGIQPAAQEAQPVGAPPAVPDEQRNGLPGLTEAGREALRSARLASSAVWRTHLDGLPRALGRVEAGLPEAGYVGDVLLPGCDARVLAAVEALPSRALGRLQGGRFVNHLALRTVVARAGVSGLRESSPGFRVRRAAATYLHQRRPQLAAELARGSALAELGLLEPAPVLRLLRDGQASADRALLLLRLCWIDRWLRRR